MEWKGRGYIYPALLLSGAADGHLQVSHTHYGGRPTRACDRLSGSRLVDEHDAPTRRFTRFERSGG